MSEAKPQDHDVKYGFLLKVLGGTVVFMVLVCAFIYWLYFFFLGLEKKTDPAPPILTEASLPISVPLLANPERELDRLETKDSQRLDAYGWVDEASGIAHLPIAEAIKIVAEREANRPQTEVAPDSPDDETASPTTSE